MTGAGKQSHEMTQIEIWIVLCDADAISPSGMNVDPWRNIAGATSVAGTAFTFPEHLSLSSVFSGVQIAQSLVSFIHTFCSVL